MGLDMYLDKYDKKGKHVCEVAYWRKANQIRKWFADLIDSGKESVSGTVGKEDLEKLVATCKDVIAHCPLKPGKVTNGYTMGKDDWEPILVDGEIMTNVEYAKKVLPTSRGFFFGSEEYDQYYIEDLKDTIEQVEKILKETDFENEEIRYAESW